MSVEASIEMSVSASESVPDEDASLADETDDKRLKGIPSVVAMSGNEGGIDGEVCVSLGILCCCRCGKGRGVLDINRFSEL